MAISATSALNNHVLVLNKNWTVIGSSTVREAIILISRDSAKGVCPETFNLYTWDTWINKLNAPVADAYIKTPTIEVPAPQIILLTKYDEIHTQHVKFNSKAIYKRDNYTCLYCGKKKKVEDLSIDHVVPRSRGGPTNFENCISCCTPCNNSKGSKLLSELGIKLPKTPTRPPWNPILHVNPDNRPASWDKLLKKEWL